ncbi:MAG TPA: D-hexose-6-phosphate mutarotase [Acidobacteriaceae bacterium]|nr:D-hexose-6-phosphate mutarotase [Acidobacteriaceae bacterium]
MATDLASLQRRFASTGFLTFDRQGALVRAHIATAHATATIYLQGAHLTAWQPASQQPVIFLSRKSDFLPGKPIRGGIPIAFPWFATDSKRDRIDGHPGPSHGFARISEWTLSAAVRSGDNAVLTFDLGPNDLSRALGFAHFHLKMVFTVGPILTLAMTVTNDDDKPLRFEEAFHSYYAVTDIHEVAVTGLEPTGYIDKTDNMKRVPAANAPLTFTRFTDRVYNNTAATCIVHDGTVKRRIVVRKENSNTTVVWNPWNELPDLGPWEWHEMLAIETANTAENAVTLAPGASHTMRAIISVEKA